MKAITVESLGAPEVLRLTEVEVPQPEAGNVLVKVEAIGINFADVMMRTGSYPNGPAPGFIPGLEVAGTVASGPRQGEAVMGFTWTGGYAEYAVVPEAMLFRIPPGLSKAEAAGFLVTHLTAYFALWMADLKPDERVLIHSAAGGVGTAAVQLARNMGAEIFATAGSEEKLARLKALGAEHPINYRAGDFADEVRRLTEGEGVDIVLESLGGGAFERDLELLRPLGRMVVYGALTGETRPVDPGFLLARNISVHGLYLGGLMGQPELVEQALSEMQEYIRRGRLKVIIGGQFPLAQAVEAHRQLESRGNFGKIVLIP